MARTTIESRIRSSQALASDLVSFAGPLSLGLEERFGGSFPDQRETFERFAVALLAARRELVARDHEHREQILEGRAVRRRRDRLSRQLQQVLIRLRSVLAGVLGTQEAETFLELGDRTSRDPVVLEAQAHRVHERLASLDLAEVNVARVRQDLHKRRNALREAIRATSEAHQLQIQTQLRRTEAAKAVDEIHGPARKALLAFSELARVEAVAPWLHKQATKAGRPGKSQKATAPALQIPVHLLDAADLHQEPPLPPQSSSPEPRDA